MYIYMYIYITATHNCITHCNAQCRCGMRLSVCGRQDTHTLNVSAQLASANTFFDCNTAPCTCSTKCSKCYSSTVI